MEKEHAVQGGEGSKTAEFVCLARAAAHGVTKAPSFSDPTALALLSEEAKASLMRFRSGAALPDDLFVHHVLRMRSEVIVARTVAVDEAVRGRVTPQLVNLGAGLDGRAWRMSELADTVVFEVDHPATQAGKRLRAEALTPLAKEVRFVAVDLARASLHAALASAGHASGTPTLWLLEGVVPYLGAVQVEATLAVVRGRSAPGSRVVVVYQSPEEATAAAPPAATARAQSPWMNEPLQSWWTPAQMRAQLERAGFHVALDRDLAELAAIHGADLTGAGQRVREGRVAVADRR